MWENEMSPVGGAPILGMSKLPTYGTTNPYIPSLAQSAATSPTQKVVQDSLPSHRNSHR